MRRVKAIFPVTNQLDRSGQRYWWSRLKYREKGTNQTNFITFGFVQLHRDFV